MWMKVIELLGEEIVDNDEFVFFKFKIYDLS